MKSEVSVANLLPKLATCIAVVPQYWAIVLNPNYTSIHTKCDGTCHEGKVGLPVVNSVL